ncbi:MAG: hypothetical protein J6N70_06185 [Oribacterium sp.]|nr:hypothetical protein [Ruminiclostridium sp.]MBO6308422.1 hypothetical protein [Oribacterium sp.]
MRRNELLTTTAVAEENENIIKLPESCRQDFVKAMKIGYYKEFYKQGFITSDQLEALIAMQEKQREIIDNNEVA